jgi:hypothetical protein
MAVIVIKNLKSGESLRYAISDEWLPKIFGWIKSDPSARYDSAMSTEGLFQMEPVKSSPHRRNRVRDVTFGSQRRSLWVGNRWGPQVS